MWAPHALSDDIKTSVENSNYDVNSIHHEEGEKDTLARSLYWKKWMLNWLFKDLEFEFVNICS